MASRLDAIALNKIVRLNTKVDPQFALDAANYLTNRVCATAVVPNTTDPYYTEAELTLIESWLAAHFYCVRESKPRVQQVSTLRQDVQSKVDLGLNVTHYGQQAMRLDTAGGLAALEKNSVKGRKKIKGGVKWLGTPFEDNLTDQEVPMEE